MIINIIIIIIDNGPRETSDAVQAPHVQGLRGEQITHTEFPQPASTFARNDLKHFYNTSLAIAAMN